MQIDGFKQIQLPELKKPKTGGLMDAIKKGAGAAIGTAIKKIADDADQTVKPKGPAATSKLELGQAAKMVGEMAADGSQNMNIGYRTRISSSGNGELTSI